MDRNVLIVDDESYFLEYLIHLIDWKKMGFRIFHTSNPNKALEILKEEPIDLLLTDIRMPEISGIDLLIFVKARYPKTAVIFLSGYSDFEYAKSGIQYGLFDYLLKPVTKESLEESVKRFLENTLRLQPQKISLGQLVLELLKNMVDTRHPFPYLADNLLFQENVEFVELVTDEATSPGDTLVVGEKRLFLLSTSDFSLQKDQYEALSEPFSLQVKESRQRALFNALTGLWVTKKDYEDLMRQYTMDYFKMQWKGIEKGTGKITKNLLVQAYSAFHFLAIEATEENFSLEKLALLQREEQITAYLMQLNHQLAGKDVNQQTIEKINSYIESHLADALSLEEIASVVFLNAAYLSKFYKKETGENLSTYILDQRLSRASSLLTDSNLLISDISKMVGFNSSQYFIRVFKEKYQMTPQQYRRAHFI